MFCDMLTLLGVLEVVSENLSRVL
jgi:hypothetical protein